MGMDWTHPDFRASGMTADGTAYGMVENRRGAFRERDRLVLAGGAYHEQIPNGSLVVTSGLGGVFPRGIPIGRIDGIADVEAQWQKNYWLRPMVLPGEATHVLVAIGPADHPLHGDSLPGDSLAGDALAGDVLFGPSAAWPVDSVMTRVEVMEAERAARDSLAALSDSVEALRARIEALLGRPPLPPGTGVDGAAGAPAGTSGRIPPDTLGAGR